MHSATSINKLVIDPHDQKLLSKPMQLQEKWRQKQVKLLYKTGRPIFGVFFNKVYIPYHKLRSEL
jgi:hypothetical protein|tara:strand:+ start:421 stop:615 length:195 start_codon:yes stop_codon:yes gene_type:complete